MPKRDRRRRANKRRMRETAALVEKPPQPQPKTDQQNFFGLEKKKIVDELKQSQQAPPQPQPKTDQQNFSGLQKEKIIDELKPSQQAPPEPQPEAYINPLGFEVEDDTCTDEQKQSKPAVADLTETPEMAVVEISEEPLPAASDEHFTPPPLPPIASPSPWWRKRAGSIEDFLEFFWTEHDI